MKVLPFTITKSEKDALILQEDQQIQFYSRLHQHQELQISYIKKGEGSLLVGDTVSPYQEGALVILGSNLPHVFKSNRRLQQESHMLSIFFTEHSFGKDFFKTEELKSLQSFFTKASQGFVINKPTEGMVSIINTMLKASKLDRFILFFTLLQQINRAPYHSLSSFVSTKKYTDVEGKRMSAVMQYTMNHFTEKITLHRVAKEAAMTPTAFCSYFKKRTRKTYFQFLTELRIEAATNLLQKQPELSVATIAEESGFQNISNFNRKFKAITATTPLQYKKRWA